MPKRKYGEWIDSAGIFNMDESGFTTVQINVVGSQQRKEKRELVEWSVVIEV